MKLLWFSWKDIKNPQSGGAEVITDELLTRLVKDGHEVILLTALFTGAKETELRNGYKIIRVGGRYSVYFQAYKYYKKNLKNWADTIIEEVNTIPFFTKWYAQPKPILFFHQLCRQVWFHQMVFPMSLIGYLLEPIYLFLLSSSKVITISESTKKDLMRYGFKKKNISIISEGIHLKPLENLTDVQKYDQPTLLSLGAVREMKRTGHIVKAFESARRRLPKLKLLVAGGAGSTYGKKVLSMIKDSPYSDCITYLGRVSEEKKMEVMQRSHVIVVASVKEGWGLIVTEANSQGTPAAVYNVDGLRDSVQNGITGTISKKNTPEALADSIVALLEDPEKYETLRKNAWEWSKEITFEKCYSDFLKVLSKLDSSS